MTRSTFVLRCALASLVVWACTCPPNVTQFSFSCTTDSDCLDGWSCIAERCVSSGPGLDGGDGGESSDGGECGAASCPDGCCTGGRCVARSPSTCGTGGETCRSCDAHSDTCSSAGACGCGQGPACEPNAICVDGGCTCDPASCDGCCSGAVCSARTLTTCGGAGPACAACDLTTADSCADAGCACGAFAACGAGQRCQGGACVCDAVSCPGGCCNGTVCTAPSAAGCGMGGTSCTPCDGGDSCSQGSCRCGQGPSCGDGQTCLSGLCRGGTCDAVSCDAGCCSAGACNPRGLATCGTLGSACTSCDPGQADTCAGDGTCRCGDAGACPSGQRCSSGACVCDSSSCPTGCCAGASCVAPSLTGCGRDGGSCLACDPLTADVCANGACGCGAGPPCGVGQRCVGGLCRCDGVSCPSGCCSGQLCVDGGLATSCGAGGAACANCSLSGETCRAGLCSCGDAGSCSFNGVCQSGQCSCIAPVRVTNEPNLQSIWLAGTSLRPRIDIVANLNHFYAECNARCDRADPVFAVGTWLPDQASNAHAASVIELPDGGVAMAATISAGSDYVAYGECGTNCFSAASWSWYQRATGFTSSVPVVAAGPGLSGYVLEWGGFTRFADCGSGCARPTATWAEEDIDSETNRGPLPFGFGPGDAGITVRHYVGNDGYRRCTSSCGSPGSWSAPVPVGSFLMGRLIAAPLPRVAGLTSPDSGTSTWRLLYAACVRGTCTDAGDWSTAVLATDVRRTTGGLESESIGFQLDSSGYGRIVYSRRDGGLGLLTETDAGWASSAVMSCGSPIAGTHPALLVSPAGNLRVLYERSGDYFYYVSGP